MGKASIIFIILFSSCIDPSDYEAAYQVQITSTQSSESKITGYLKCGSTTVWRPIFNSSWASGELVMVKGSFYHLHLERDYTPGVSWVIDTYSYDGQILRHLSYRPVKVDNRLVIEQTIVIN